MWGGGTRRADNREGTRKILLTSQLTLLLKHVKKKNHFGVANFKTWCLAQSRCLGFQNSGHVSGPYGQGSF